VIQYVERESSMTSLRVRAEKERELAEAEAYWRRRFVKQEQEVQKHVFFIHNKFFRPYAISTHSLDHRFYILSTACITL
jgi:hypothetical protein